MSIEHIAVNAKGCSLLTGRNTSIIVLASAAVLLLTSCLVPPHAERQAMVHAMGHQVMPFDLSMTRHIFEMTEDGGVQQVIVKNPQDREQIQLIRAHLQHEAMRFQAGDFADPAALHGADMPGLKELAAGTTRIKVAYAELPLGAQIAFTTDELRLITAIHRWFGAQLSDHGPDATYR